MALQRSSGPHQPDVREVVFKFPIGCKVMVDAAVRLLSLANQLNHTFRRVRLEFDEGEAGVMGYFNRMGFFDCLAEDIEVTPDRPFYSSASLFRGTSDSLVEIASINPADRIAVQNVPGRLADALVNACSRRKDIKALEKAAFTVFAELISNILDHSSTRLDGFAVLQLYKRKKRKTGSLKVSVSDSGIGILDTLRPALNTTDPALAKLTDTELLVEVIRQGISRHGKTRGQGLKGSAKQALKYHAQLDVRLPQSRIVLIPSRTGYEPHKAYSYGDLPLIWGTHISFEFDLT
ncbi:MAG: ATP-binding protein [Gammaproteobacteria bacterium]|nr:MAG: ATP-binding protein [Gammaproteobacteria bacterium]